MSQKGFSDLDNLFKHIEKKYIKNSLNTSVKKEAVKTMQEHIQKDVYDAYTPYSTDGKTPHYERTGKLLKEIEAELIDENTLVIENTRSENGRDIVDIIEHGKGYDWGYVRNLDEEIGARPFVENTRKSLSDGRVEKIIKDDLRKRGLNVK